LIRNFKAAVFNICYYTRDAGRRHLALFLTPNVISKIQHKKKSHFCPSICRWATSSYSMTHFKCEIQFQIIRPNTARLVASIMMRFTTNLYCNILGYDAVQFGVYILTFPRKISPQNYGQNMEVKCTFSKSNLTKAMNSKIYGEQLQKEKLNAELWSRRWLAYYSELTRNPAEYYCILYTIFLMKTETQTALLEVCWQVLWAWSCFAFQLPINTIQPITGV